MPEPSARMLVPTVAFLAVSLFVGLYSAKRIKGSVRNYFVGGNVFPAWVVIFSMSGQAIELGGTQGTAELAMQGSFWDAVVLPVGVGLSLILIGLFFARRLHAMRLLTLPDFFARRFDGRVGAIAAILNVVSFVILIAGNLAGMGLLLQYFLGWPIAHAVSLIASLVVVYTIAGGLFAVTWNDILQIGIACVAIVVAVAWTVATLSPAEVLRILDASLTFEPLVEPGQGALKIWASLLALALGDIVAIDFMERVFAARSARTAVIACLISGVCTIVIGCTMAVLGVIAGALGTTSEPSFIAFVDGFFPSGIKMIVVMGLIGCGLSTVDGAIMACAKVLARNVLQPAAPEIITNERLLAVSRGTTIPIALLATVIAVAFPVPGDLLVLAFDVVFAGCFVPLALGAYTKLGGPRAALWAIIVPSALRVTLHFEFLKLGLDPRWNGLETLIPPCVSVVLYLAVSWLETRPVKEVIAA